MTAPKGGEVIQPYAAPHLLAPGTVTRPGHISPDRWARMGWYARWKATRDTVPEPTWLLTAHANRDSLDRRLAIRPDSTHVRHSVAS